MKQYLDFTGFSPQLLQRRMTTVSNEIRNISSIYRKKNYDKIVFFGGALTISEINPQNCFETNHSKQTKLII